MNQVNDTDRELLAGIFASRVTLAKMTAEEAVEQAKTEHAKTLVWVASESKQPRSFHWFCQEFEIDPGAVRKAIKDRRK